MFLLPHVAAAVLFCVARTLACCLLCMLRPANVCGKCRIIGLLCCLRRHAAQLASFCLCLCQSMWRVCCC